MNTECTIKLLEDDTIASLLRAARNSYYEHRLSWESYYKLLLIGRKEFERRSAEGMTPSFLFSKEIW